MERDLVHIPRREVGKLSRLMHLGIELRDACVGLLSLASVLFAEKSVATGRKVHGTIYDPPRKVLVLQLYDTLGDVICTSPLYRELAANFPAATISVAVSAHGIPGLLQQNPYVSEVIPVSIKCNKWLRPLLLPWRHWLLSRRVLKQRSFDVAIIPRSSVDFCYATFLAYFSGSPIRIGYTESTNERKAILNRGWDRLLTVPLAPLPRSTNEVTAILNVLSALGKSASRDHTEIWLTTEDRQYASNALASAGPRRVCISPTSGHSRLKQWGVEQFAELAADLIRNDCTIILLGGPQDIALAAIIEERLNGVCVNLAGRTSIREMAAVMADCDVYVGNDAGPAHVASAADVPTITIFGSSCHHQFAPWGQRNRVLTVELKCGPCRTGHEIDRCTRCIYDTPKCLEAIPVVEVLEATLSVLTPIAVQEPAGTIR